MLWSFPPNQGLIGAPVPLFPIRLLNLVALLCLQATVNPSDAFEFTFNDVFSLFYNHDVGYLYLVFTLYRHLPEFYFLQRCWHPFHALFQS